MGLRGRILATLQEISNRDFEPRKGTRVRHVLLRLPPGISHGLGHSMGISHRDHLQEYLFVRTWKRSGKATFPGPGRNEARRKSPLGTHRSALRFAHSYHRSEWRRPGIG